MQTIATYEYSKNIYGSEFNNEYKVFHKVNPFSMDTIFKQIGIIDRHWSKCFEKGSIHPLSTRYLGMHYLNLENNKMKKLKQRGTLHILKNTVIAMWDSRNEKTFVNWKVQPVMNAEYLLQTSTRLVNNGHTSAKELSNIFHSILISKKYRFHFGMANPTTKDILINKT